MKQLVTATLFLFLAVCNLNAQDTAVFPLGEKAANVHHTGDVWLYYVSRADSTFNHNIVVATFAAGAKLNWHQHPAGQQLMILEGKGFYQERGKELQIVKKGDHINCPPHIEHWHAATPSHGVTYLAITGNQKTVWLEEISEKEYQNIKED